MKSIFLISASFLLFSFSNAQRTYFLTDIEGSPQTLEQRMDYHKVQGASLAIIRNFEMDTLITLGVRDQKQGLSVNENTLFQMGSMTGAIVNFAVLRLVAAGRIDLDAPANDYLTSWKIEAKSFTKRKPITVRDLILERRGFNPVYKPQGYLPGIELPSVQQILAGEAPSNLAALDLKKNKSKKSSLANDLILQILLEDIYNKSFAAIIEAQVFQPLNMTQSIIAAELSDEQKQNACIGYEENGTVIEGERLVYPELAHSGLWSTPQDYAKFVLHVLKAAQGLDNSLLNQELAKAGIEPQYGNNALILLKGDNQIYWGGAPRGFYSQMAASAEEGWVVVGCSNRQLAWQFVNWDLNSRAIEYAKR
ncbi:MAG: serine hydrolase domain-containing protein [Bacteroidota bacterium]